MPEAKFQPESERMSARDALMEASAETTVGVIRQRKWIILFVGFLLSATAIIAGGAIAYYQRGAPSNIAGVVSILVGLLTIIGTISNYRKVNSFLSKYDDKHVS